MTNIRCRFCDHYLAEDGKCPECEALQEGYDKAFSGGEVSEENEQQLLECADCGHRVSKRAESCPNCGRVFVYGQPPLPLWQRGCNWGCGGIIAITVLLGLLWLLGAIISRENSQQTSREPLSQVKSKELSTPLASEWKKIASWKGPGDKRTARFAVGNEWRINYSHTSSSHFAIWLNDANGEHLDLLENIGDPVENTSYFYKAGTYTLEISGSGSWVVSVETKG